MSQKVCVEDLGRRFSVLDNVVLVKCPAGEGGWVGGVHDLQHEIYTGGDMEGLNEPVFEATASELQPLRESFVQGWV